MKQLVLHIGTHKTATTSLQRFMMLNADKFADQGLYVPQIPGKYPTANHDRTGFFLDRLAKSVSKPGSVPDEYLKLAKQDLDCFKDVVSQHDRVFLSDERLWYEGADRKIFWPTLKRYVESAGIESCHLIVYLRRQDEFITSLWAQFTKGLNTLTLSEFASKPSSRRSMDYLKGLQEIEECFGEGNVTVRVFDRSKFIGGDIYQDFCDALGVRYDDTFKKPELLNPSLTRNVAEIKLIANSSVTYQESINFLRKTAINTAAAFEESPNTAYLNSEQRDEILETYAAGNEAIARKYLNWEDGMLFPPPRPRDPDWSALTPEMLRDMCYFFTEAIAAEHKSNQQLADRVRQLERLPFTFITLKVKRKLYALLHPERTQ